MTPAQRAEIEAAAERAASQSAPFTAEECDAIARLLARPVRRVHLGARKTERRQAA